MKVYVVVQLKHFSPIWRRLELDIVQFSRRVISCLRVKFGRLLLTN